MSTQHRSAVPPNPKEYARGRTGSCRAGLATPTPALTPQQQAQLASLIRFRPSTKDVISGIAPHVFEDPRTGLPYRRRRPRSRTPPRHRPGSECRPRVRRSPSPALSNGRGGCRSPLRRAVVLAADAEEQKPRIHLRVESRERDNVVVKLFTPPPNKGVKSPAPPTFPAPGPNIRSVEIADGKDENLLAPQLEPTPDTQKQIVKSRGFRIERVFKTFSFRRKDA